jgi:hypothetical protein
MKTRLLLSFAAVFLVWGPAGAKISDPAAQARVDEQIKVIATWAADPTVVDAVKAHNVELPPEQRDITQEKWSTLSVLDPLVRGFTRNAAGQFLKARKTDFITEAFVSDAKGLKVAFLAKTTNWSHLGKPKHDVPMSGQPWQGSIEVDESTGRQQLQVAVPVLDAGQPIGSLVVGLNLDLLRQ